MIKIQDVVVPTKGTAKYLKLLALNFSPNPTSVSFYWSIHEESVTPAEGDNPEVKTAGATLLDGNITMSESSYANWGTDDNYVIDWALGELNFTKVTE